MKTSEDNKLREDAELIGISSKYLNNNGSCVAKSDGLANSVGDFDISSQVSCRKDKCYHYYGIRRTQDNDEYICPFDYGIPTFFQE